MMDGWRCVLDVEEHVDIAALTDTEVMGARWLDSTPATRGNSTSSNRKQGRSVSSQLLVTLPNAVLCCKADGKRRAILLLLSS
jgi:hypothetical protein